MLRPLLILAVSATLLVGAQAQTVVNSFSVPPTGSAFVGGLDYDPIADTLWTVDQTNDLIQEFDRNGNLLRTIVAPTVPGISSPLPIGAGLDPLTGTLWVGDEAEIVYGLSVDGTFNGVSWSTQPHCPDVSGLAYDPATDTIWIANDSAHTLTAFDRTGALVAGPISVPSSTDSDGLAINPITGTFYLGEDTGDRILEVDATGTVIATFTITDPTFGTISPEGLGLDTRTGSLFVGDGFVTRRVYEVTGIVPPCANPPVLFGSGCADSGGRVPRHTVDNCTGTVGTTFTVGVAASPSVNASALFLLSLTPPGGPIPIDPGLAPGCDLLVIPLATLGPVPVVNGRSGIEAIVPPMAGGAMVHSQVGIFPDPGANPLGLVMTNGVTTTF